jgi:hypothetical protein
MNNGDVAIEYLTGFSEGDLDRIKRVLADGFEFNGPFLSGKSAEEYIKTLEADPPEKSLFKIISMFYRDDEVCIIYRFEKPGVVADMAQLFKFEAGKISKSKLIFDSRLFT